MSDFLNMPRLPIKAVVSSFFCIIIGIILMIIYGFDGIGRIGIFTFVLGFVIGFISIGSTYLMDKYSSKNNEVLIF